VRHTSVADDPSSKDAPKRRSLPSFGSKDKSAASSETGARDSESASELLALTQVTRVLCDVVVCAR
jgi:hypothetical protein